MSYQVHRGKRFLCRQKNPVIITLFILCFLLISDSNALAYTGNCQGLSAGDYHTCILKSNGNVDCYGRNDQGQAADYMGGDAVGVSVGLGHTCVLKSNGNVDCYGYNVLGSDYLGGDGVGGVAGDDHTCVLKSNGNVDCYGNNTWGQAADYMGANAVCHACSAPPVSAPTLTSPANGATGISTTPTREWNYVLRATLYDAMICLDSGCTTGGIRFASVKGRQWIVTPPLNPNTTYYWKARAGNSCGSFDSALRSFTTQSSPPGAFSKISPSNGATNISTSPTLSWGSSSGAYSYWYCYDTTNNGSCEGSWINVGPNRNVALSGLSPGITYYWQVYAYNFINNTFSNGGEWWSFTTAAPFCTDNDGDGYGNPGDASCSKGSATDCNDNNSSINPGATEGPDGSITCSDGKDNDCDGKTDSSDSGCAPIALPMPTSQQVFEYS